MTLFNGMGRVKVFRDYEEMDYAHLAVEEDAS